MRGGSAIAVNLSGRQHPSCSWCGNEVGPGDGYRLVEHGSGRGAVFCRLEHVIPWGIQGAHLEPREPDAPVGSEGPAECAHCGAALSEGRFVLVRHRGEHRIADGFCSIEHLIAWAKAGGRWRA
jgi:hypothetical protein